MTQLRAYKTSDWMKMSIDMWSLLWCNKWCMVTLLRAGGWEWRMLTEWPISSKNYLSINSDPPVSLLKGTKVGSEVVFLFGTPTHFRSSFLFFLNKSVRSALTPYVFSCCETMNLKATGGGFCWLLDTWYPSSPSSSSPRAEKSLAALKESTSLGL